MLRKILIIASLTGAFSAFAQTATGNGTPGVGNGGSVEITVTGTVLSSVSLDITGSGGTVLTGTTVAGNPTAAVGTLDFGSFSSQTPATATNTTFAARASAGVSGAIVAATLSATMHFTGALSGVILLTRKVAAGGGTDIPAGNLRAASPPLATWWTGTDGQSVPDPIPGSEIYICTGAGGTCVSNVPYLHQLAVFVPDSQPAGLFTTVVTYVATAF